MIKTKLCCGEKYDIMSAVAVKAMMLGLDGRCEEGRTWIEMELVCQTVIAIEQMKKMVTVLPSKNSEIRSPFLYEEYFLSLWKEI